MTWSIIARDDRTGRIGIAVATRFFAVGARVPHIKTGVGAVASQAFVNPFYGPQGLALLQAGAAPEDVVRMLTNADDGRDHRQLHLMDRNGRFAAFTGAACVDWCGHKVHDGFSIAGNMLAGPRVIEETARSYKRSTKPFARRLIAAMRAGEAAGGDNRGKQSAALLIHDDQDYSLLDLRVDDHKEPLTELARLERIARERWLHFRRVMPSKQNPSGLTDRATLEEEIAKSIAEGYE